MTLTLNKNVKFWQNILINENKVLIQNIQIQNY